MKRFFTALFLFIVSFTLKIPSDVKAVDYMTTFHYGETYMCDQVFSASIVDEPGMFMTLEDKLPLLVEDYEPATQSYVDKQIVIKFAHAKKDTMLLQVHLKIRNLNNETLVGLSPKSFALIGRLLDRDIVYYPIIVTPFDITDDYWTENINEVVKPIKNLTPSMKYYELGDFGTFYYEDRNINPLRTLDLRLVYMVKPFLTRWRLNIDPQPVKGVASDLTTAYYEDPHFNECSLSFLFPSVRNEETGITEKYVYVQ